MGLRFLIAAMVGSVCCATSRADDTVVLGLPLEHTTTSAIFPGLGERAGIDVAPRIGQTFVVPAGHPYLSSFSFWLGDSHIFDPQPTTFRAVIAAYGADRPAGEALFTSRPYNTAALRHGELRRLDFEVGLPLDALSRYLFFLDTVPFRDGIDSYATFASGADFLPDGELVYTYSGGGISDEPWQVSGAGWDLDFRAEFAAVPEPASLALLCLAGIVLAAVLGLRFVRSRRRVPLLAY
jgi:hypothetical protein